MFVRADKIDLKSLDIQLEKKMSKVWTKDNRGSTQRPKEEWEIDVSKLDVRYVLARGTYGTVYRGSYDGQEVAGLYFHFVLFFVSNFHVNFCNLLFVSVCSIACKFCVSSLRRIVCVFPSVDEF